MSAPVRFGLVGYGFGGRHFHAPLLASAAGCDLLGVVTTDPGRQDLVREQLGRPSYASLRELADAGAEAVAISTPVATHVPLAQEALRLGLAVVCDKPFSLDAASARATVELARTSGLALSAYQNRRWDSDFRTVQRLVADGRLGEVRRFESRFERFRPDGGPGAAGGGALLDLGSHLADQALLLLGPVTSVYAELHAGEDGLDDDTFVALTHRDGVRAHLWASWRQGAPGPRYRVAGTLGAYVVGGLDGQEAALVAGESLATLGERWGVEPESGWGRLHRDVTGDGDSSDVVPTERGAWDGFYPAFAAAVRGEGPVPVDPADTVALAEVLDAARASAATGRTVSLPRG